MKTLIIGMSEVGRALCEVLRAPIKHFQHGTGVYEKPGPHEVTTFDKTDPPSLILFQPTDVLNICYPYGPRFEEQVSHYVDGCRPMVCIIHSTVPVGTTRKIQHLTAKNGTTRCYHSPIHGQHPRLVEGIRTFTKYLGGCAKEEKGVVDAHRGIAGKFLTDAGIKVATVENAETSELSKLMCTAQTAMGILVQQEIHRLCDVHNADFREVYTAWNLHYNEGYRKLAAHRESKAGWPLSPDYSRPIYSLNVGPLGGHCLFQNAALIESWVTKAIREHGGPKDVEDKLQEGGGSNKPTSMG